MARSTTFDMTAGAGRVQRRRRTLVRLLIVVGIIGVLVAGAAVWLRQALPQIAAAEIGRLMNARAEMGAISLCLDGSVSVAGLVVRPRQDELLHENTILLAENVQARFSRRSLIFLSPRVTEIRVEDFLLDARLNLNTGRWNLGTLRFQAPRGRGGGLPALHLQRGKLRYCQISGVQQEVVMSIPIEARFGHDVEGDPSYSFEIRTSKLSGGYGESRLTGRWRPCSVLQGPGYTLAEPAELTLTGGLSSTDIPSLERAWAIDVLAGELKYDRSGSYSLNLRLKDLRGKHAPEVDTLRFLAPGAEGSGPWRSLQAFFAEYQPTGTVGSITIKASGNTKKLHESEIDGKVVCQDISVCDSKFPYRIDHLSGELEFTQSTMRANRLVGKHGDVEVCIDGWTRGFGSDRQYQYQVTSPNMVLDEALYDALNPGQKRFWDAFRPTGTVGVDYRLTRTSPVDRRLSISVDLNDVTAAFQGFPYPLAGLTGTLFFDRRSIVLSDIVSRADGKQIRVNGKVTEPAASSPTYYISIDAKDIPLDATLRDALPTRHRELFRQLDVNGLADIRARVFSIDDANGVAPLRRGEGVSGSPTYNSTLGEVVSSASPPRSEAAAAIGPEAAPKRPEPEAVSNAESRTDGNQALPASASGGRNDIDAAAATVSRRISFLADVLCRKSSLRLPLYPPEPSGPTASSVGPQPPAERGPVGGRPLVLSDITAEATITPDSLSIRKLEGRQGGSPVAMTGGVRFGERGEIKQCRIEATAQQVPLDDTTMSLLPPSMMRQAAAFHPEGDVNLTVELKKADRDEPPEYAVVMDCLGDRINHDRFAYPLQDLRGTISFTKNNIVLKNVTAKPQDGPSSDFGWQQTADMNSPSALRSPQATIQVDGSATMAGGQLEEGSFTLQATNLVFAESLGRVLPKTVAGLYGETSPEGSFDLELTTLKVSKRRAPDSGPGAAGDETRVEFGGKMNLGPSPQKRDHAAGDARQPCRLKVSQAPVELSGVLEVEGSYSTKHGFERGRARLAAERLVVKGKAITDTNIDASYDPNTQKWTTADFVGHCYGGKLLGRLEVGPPRDGGSEPDAGASSSTPGAPGPGFEYVLQVAFNDVDLQQYLLADRPVADGQKAGSKDLAPSASSGTMDAWLSLQARMGDPKRERTPGDRSPARGPDAPRRGIFSIDIANMQVGKVSPLGTVVSVLRLSEPTDYKFERMLIDSYIRGDKLLVSKLDLSGRNTAFAGSGTMDLPSEEINLTLTARSQRAAAGPSMLQSLTEGLGGAVVRIEVTGQADSPRVQTKALPVIEDSLRILGTPEEGRKGKK